MELRIIRNYPDEETFEEITTEEAIEKLEGGGYYLSGTVKQILASGIKQDLHTNFATYSFC